MKIILLSVIALSVILSPAYGQLLSDATGIVNRLDIQSDGRAFEVKTVSNFDIIDFDFNGDEKILTLYISSGLENNLGELVIPTELLGGNLTFQLNDLDYSPDVKYSKQVSFITLNFTGSGDSHIKISATETLPGAAQKPQDETPSPPVKESSPDGGGCLVATATYGTELSPQIQQLREIRDNQLLSTGYGTALVSSFNQFYYSFSPAVADFERESPVFKELVKTAISPMIVSLSVLNHVEMVSEVDTVVVMSGLIMLNLGMYVGVPASAIIALRKYL